MRDECRNTGNAWGLIMIKAISLGVLVVAALYAVGVTPSSIAERLETAQRDHVGMRTSGDWGS